MSMLAQPNERTIEPILLTARQAARWLNISERTLYARTADGSIAVVRIGNRGIRYDPADLRRWIERAKNSEKSA
ncbi:MAG: helix-turn-helix domain-containing protein [Planctomycetes bacterium]|nr:helix-turn-helix domain-containing protein [Planctomycetota bacterium]